MLYSRKYEGRTIRLGNKFQQYSYNLQSWPKRFGILQSFSRGLIDCEWSSKISKSGEDIV